MDNQYVSDEAPVSLGDVLSDDLVRATEFVVLYITDDGQYLSMCMGDQAIKFSKQYSLTPKWRNFKRDASVMTPRYRCIHCAYSNNYLYNMIDHHRGAHPEFIHLKNDQKWVAHYSKFTNRQPERESEKVNKPPEAEGQAQDSYAIGKYKCPHCNYKSMYYQNLNDHMAAEHGHVAEAGRRNTHPESLESGESQTVTSELQALSGSEDDQLYKDEEVEEKDSTNNIVSTTDVIREEPSSSHPKPNSKSAVACEFCNQMFDHKRLKDIHVNSFHRVGDSYCCPYCHQNVTCQNWPEHLKKHTTDTGNAYCHLCCKKFKSMRNLKNHRIEVHEEGKIHACPEPGCSSGFARARNLRSHLALHRGSKQHMCDICGEGYALKSSLSKHRKTKHPEEPPVSAANNTQIDKSVLSLQTIPDYGQQQPSQPLPQPLQQQLPQQIPQHVPHQIPQQLPQDEQNPPAAVCPQVKGKVLVTTQPDGSLVVTSKPGDRVDFSQQGAVLVLPQSQVPNAVAPQVEGTVVVMEQSNGTNNHVTQTVRDVATPPSNKKVIKRQSYLDLTGTKIRRQSSLDFGTENQGKFEGAPNFAPPTASESLPRCRYCKDLYFNTKQQLKSHILDVHKVTSSQDAADLEASRNCRPEVKLVSQFSNTPHTQLSQDLIEAAYLLSLQHEQQQELQEGNYMGPPLSDVAQPPLSNVAGPLSGVTRPPVADVTPISNVKLE